MADLVSKFLHAFGVQRPSRRIDPEKRDLAARQSELQDLLEREARLRALDYQIDVQRAKRR